MAANTSGARHSARRVLLRPARLQPGSHRSRGSASRDRPVDRRRCLSFSDRYRLHSRSRVWTWPVPTTDHPRRRHVRRRRHLSNRGRPDLHRAGASCALFRIDGWFARDADRRSHRRIAPAGLLFDDAGEQWRVHHSMRVACGTTRRPSRSDGHPTIAAPTRWSTSRDASPASSVEKPADSSTTRLWPDASLVSSERISEPTTTTFGVSHESGSARLRRWSSSSLHSRPA